MNTLYLISVNFLGPIWPTSSRREQINSIQDQQYLVFLDAEHTYNQPIYPRGPFVSYSLLECPLHGTCSSMIRIYSGPLIESLDNVTWWLLFFSLLFWHYSTFLSLYN